MKAIIGDSYEVEVDATAWAAEFGLAGLHKVQEDAASVIRGQVQEALETYAARTGLLTVTRVGRPADYMAELVQCNHCEVTMPRRDLLSKHSEQPCPAMAASRERGAALIERIAAQQTETDF